MTTPSEPLRVALLGAGIFATTAHAPVLLQNPKAFDCIAVWSRRQESAEPLASKLIAKAYSGEDGLEQVLKLAELEAVVISLPLDVQADYVQKAWKAGKHVLSEKPVAPTFQQAQELVQDYRKNFAPKGIVWSVAENFRYELAIVAAAQAVQNGDIGTPFLVSMIIRTPFPPENKYLNTAWRNKPSWNGGFFVDSFVHGSAMLRMVLGCDATTVSAITSSQAEHLPDVDTLTAQVQWEGCDNGKTIQGVVSVTFACQSPRYELEVTGSNGSILLKRKVDRPGYHLRINDRPVQDFGFGGIEGEFLAFAAACGIDGTTDRNTPEEATRDLLFVESLLESGSQSGKIVHIKRAT